MVGKPDFDGKDLVELIKRIRPMSIIGAVGRCPGCFNQRVVEAMVEVNGDIRPGVFALSNPKTQAEVTSIDCWTWSGGRAIYGSGTGMPSLELGGKMFCPGQVNNVYVFPGVSKGAISCHAPSVPERFFVAAAEAVANSLDAEDLAADRVVPHRDKLRTVGVNVAAAVAWQAQSWGIAGKTLGGSLAEVKSAISGLMWSPSTLTLPKSAKHETPSRSKSCVVS